MLNYGTKIDNDDTSAGVVVADEYNSLMQEQKNSVTPFLSNVLRYCPFLLYIPLGLISFVNTQLGPKKT